MLKKTALALALNLSIAAMAQAETLRLSHWVPATHPVQVTGIEPWAKSIEEASGGDLSIQIFPAQQIGSAPDHYDMVRDGIVDISWTNPGYNAGRFPIYSLIEIPFHISGGAAGAKAIHSWYQDYAKKEMSDVFFCAVNSHETGALHSKKKITQPSELSGLNIRPAHATMARFVSNLGAAPVQVPAPEAREAIARGIADAITFPWGSIYDFGIDKEVKYHMDLPMYVSAQVLLFNKDSLNGLSEQNRQVIYDHCTPDWSQKMSQGWVDDDRAAREQMIADEGHTVTRPSEEEEALWREAAIPSLDKWKSDVAASGIDADKTYEDYLQSLQENNADY
ncbi:TRAP transporter substrate-binding protein [Marinobacterium lutimaris]|uniref:TRAP-type C4-dicarboxylate transport system, substrate-binding protein n=1 Tax=Marinobacterium lutimaris TaxID=568106 RepID=A0A1H6BYC7_9GAMM|nr:TRAP transporter substrate-binding protein [Marinobacterium lutimaris]SEG65701.1 TRAP-type C4-dicarboxylate transport system, substrate-binding protein [Marinobacterium lutimaris]